MWLAKNGQIWSKNSYLSVAIFWEFAELAQGLRLHLTQSRFKPVQHLKMTIRTSVLLKMDIHMAKKLPEKVIYKGTFVSKQSLAKLIVFFNIISKATFYTLDEPGIDCKGARIKYGLGLELIRGPTLGSLFLIPSHNC
jgi:hypothetical protein